MIKRNCCEVIKEMIEKIPVENKEFIEDLKWNYEDATYKAPEETLQWVRTGKTLEKHISLPKHLWEYEVLSIFTTKPIDELKVMIQENFN